MWLSSPYWSYYQTFASIMTADLAGACMAHFTNIEDDTASIITEPSQFFSLNLYKEGAS